MGLLDGKVAIITGSGGGIGRAHALLFAREGAKVVINDLGGSRDGTGESTRLADQVVAEIRAAGGEAVGNYDSVASFEGAQRLVKTAMDAFGRVDVLVNNAGILRDKTLLKMEEGLFDLVVAVHLKGSWNCAKFAAQAMVDGGRGGRIINTTSIAGLKGNFGQTNYGSAKAGIWGLTHTLALELKKHGVTANAIAPMAKTRMTEDIDMVPEEMKPEDISPVVLWLASDLAADVTGRTFGVHGKHLFEYRLEMTPGVEKHDGSWTPAEIQRRLGDIERLSGPAAAAGAGAAGGGAAAGGASGREPTVAEVVEALVGEMPKHLRADKAGGVTSTYHLHVKDAGQWTLRIQGGACTVAKGLEGTPSCTIKTDAGSYVAMAKGSLNPQKAFMEGKLAADNLGEAMRYGTIFRQPKPEEVAARLDQLKASLGGGAAATGAPAAAAGAPAAAAALTPEQVCEQIFARMPEIFVRDKAKGWTAEILWKVEGAGDFTVAIKDGACKTAKGAPAGKPSSTVKLHRDVLIGMVQGTVNAQKAFMEGKITADNLGDMMKFGAAFDMKKGKALADAAQQAPAAVGAGAAPKAAGAAPAAAAPAARTPRDLVQEAFARMPEIFVADKAKGWTAAILWKVDGAGDFTVRVADGAVKVSEGAPDKATCTVKLKADTFVGMLAGEVNPQKAFMEGKVTADNLGDMMKFGGAFDMKKGAEIAKRDRERAAAASAATAAAAGPAAATAAAPAAAPALVGLNRALIGKTYSGGAVFARPDHMRAYALATNDPNPRYTGDGGSQVAPPVFPVRLMKQGMFAALTDPALNCDLLRLVHGEQDMRFVRPLRPWDLVTVRARIESIEDKASGQVMAMRIPCYVEGELAVDTKATIFIRGSGGGAGKKKEAEAAAPAAPEEPRPIAFSKDMAVAADQAKRYAEASLDDNPIHLDPMVAKAAGLPDVILHGLCTMAFASRAVVEELCGGDPERLKRLAVRFTKPVLLGQTLTTRGWQVESKDGVTVYGFETLTADGARVITNGIAEVAG